VDAQVLAFIIGFLVVLGAFIWLIRYASARFSERVPQQTFDRVERLLIGGIILGAVGMFQPWLFWGYKYGFLLLLIATLGFILWSHITPAAPQYDEPT
jgi:hypothetical protein